MISNRGYINDDRYLCTGGRSDHQAKSISSTRISWIQSKGCRGFILGARSGPHLRSFPYSLELAIPSYSGHSQAKLDRSPIILAFSERREIHASGKGGLNVEMDWNRDSIRYVLCAAKDKKTGSGGGIRSHFLPSTPKSEAARSRGKGHIP